MPESARDVIAEFIRNLGEIEPGEVKRFWLIADDLLTALSEAGFVILPPEAEKRTSDAGGQ